MVSSCCRLTWAAVFAVVAVGGVLAAVLLPQAVHAQIRAGVLSYISIANSSSQGWETFIYSTTREQPQYYDLYAYDLKNLDEFLEGAKPVFREVGPITYRLHQNKIDVQPSKDGLNVSYRMWEYVVPLDPAAGNVTITTPNFVLWAVASVAGANTTSSKDLVWDVVETLFGFKRTTAEMLFQRRTVDELFFGYDDPILQNIDKLLPAAAALAPTFPGLLGNASSPAVARNRTGVSVQLTGEDDPSLARQYVQWNGMQSLECCQSGPCGGPDTASDARQPAWPSAAANDLSKGAGTSGTQFRPFLPDGGSEVKAFVDSLVRTTTLSSVGVPPVSVKGIPCQRFLIPKAEMQNSTYNPANAAYGMTGLPTGLMDLHRCEGGVPIVVSKPHFLDADPALGRAVAMEAGPDGRGRADFDTFVDVEPVTGTVMRVAERLQINMRFGPFGSNAPDAPSLVYPVGWLNKRAVLTDGEAAQWHGNIGLGLTVALAATIGGASLAGVAFIAAAICTVLSCHRKDEAEPGTMDPMSLDAYASLDGGQARPRYVVAGIQ